MSSELRVDPVDLYMSAEHMSMHHAELREAHAAADNEIGFAHTGWVGASAAALQSKMEEWQGTTVSLLGDIAAHRGAYRAAASGYTTNDADAARALDDSL